ncbi:hypothetical protein Tco_1122819 [Tanacetum coccineum]|uniref:Uncharacterized protein n=1 Tax=Tanacetum coccineum TaxID=301880 RepID=A0ABQ5J5B2_9ASTR
MAESSSRNPSSPKITPKEEPVTLDKPKSSNPFLPADQIEFTFEEIAFTTNNEVALLYPSHPNSKYFRVVSDFISKFCLKEAFIRAPTQYKEYLCEFWYTAKTLDDSKIWVSTPTREIRGDIDYAKLIWEDIIHKLSKKTREKVVPYPRFISLLLEYMMPEYDNEELNVNLTQVSSVYNWALKPNQTEGPPFTDHMKAIYNLDVHVDFKAPKPSSQTEETEASKSKTGQSEKEAQSSSAKDKSPSHPLPPTPVVGEMHKEAQQATGDPTSLGATSEEGAHPQLSSDSTAKADPVLSAPNDSKPTQQARGLKDTISALFTPDSLQDKPIIVSDESEEEEEVIKDKDTHASSHDARPSYPDINQLTNLLVTSLKPEFSKLLASHDFASCLPNALKEIPSKFTDSSREIKELKKHVQDMEIELPGDLKEIPTKLETFTSTIFSLSSQVAELKNIQWELPVEFQAQVSSVQKKIKTLDSLSSILNKVTDTLNRFSTVVENASGATTKGVPSAVQATALPAEEEKNTNPATTDVEPNLHNELVDLLGIDIMTQYYNKKLLYDKYYDKMLKRRKSSKITNYDVLTQKGPISLKVHREDGTSKVILNVKVSDLHLAEWREVVQTCPDRKENRWKTIYGLIKTRMEYLDQTKKELKIDFNKPLKEQDPLNELNDLANKKKEKN